jgi:DNA replication and repair protein RecF
VFINKLKIYNFRNLINKEFNFDQAINIFHGNNGIGKTSILEAIYYLSSGKSFRKGTFKSLINFNESDLSVYLECLIKDNKYSFSVNKNKNGNWKAKKNTYSIYKQSEITNLLPIVSIDPNVYSLVDAGPVYRRNFLDWLVFHVKHDYLLLWKKTYKCIKQLNSLYKNKASSTEIDVWEKAFIKFSEELSSIRLDFFQQLHPIIVDLSLYMQKEIHGLNIVYKKGWSEDIPLLEQLKQDRHKNLLYGQLQHGPHKMDIKISTGSLQAAQTLSRGQKKTLSITFYMAYIELLLKNLVKPILCLDDFDAELDSEKLKKAAQFFINTEAQIFITSVNKDHISTVFPNAKMFHVKH